MSITALFVGPDDADSCDGCSDAVDGNPYTIDTVPTPGSFECMSNCRHMTQLAEDAPADLAPYQWNGQFTGLNPSIGDVLPTSADYDLIDHGPPSEDVAAGGEVGAGERGDEDHGGGHAQEPTDDQVSSQVEDPAAIAQELWDSRLTPDDAIGVYDSSYGEIMDEWGLLLERVTAADLMQVLSEGNVEFLQDDLVNIDPIPALLSTMASQGFSNNQAFEAQTLAQVLGKRATLDDATGHWSIG